MRGAMNHRGARLVIFLAAVGALALVPLRAPARSPNILIVVVDTLRADRLGTYGNSRGLTPFLDELASRGTRFANAYAPSSWTCPSVASLLTSRYGIRGYATSVLGNNLTADDQSAKLRTIAETARVVWG